MALQPINQYQKADGPPAKLRFAFHNIRPRSFAAITGAPKLDIATPLMAEAGNTGYVVPWTDGSDIVGFVWPHPVQTSAAGESIGSMATSGQLNGQDIPVPSGQTEAALITALKDLEIRKIGWTVEGIGALV